MTDFTLIASNARYLDELISRGGDDAADLSVADDAEELPEVFERWQWAFSQDDRDAFVRRLSWDGLDAEELDDVLKRATQTRVDALPEWSEVLSEILDTYGPTDRRSSAADLTSSLRERLRDRFQDGGDLPPFGDLWLEFVAYASKTLESRLGEKTDRFTQSALDDMRWYLLSELSEVAAAAVYQKFERFRALQANLWGHSSFSEDQTALYEMFIQSVETYGMGSLLEEYSVLARQLVTLVTTWIESTDELIERLDRDRGRIRDRLAQGEDPGRVVEVEPGLSERHYHGCTVHSLTFESGLRVIYKPRDIALEQAFHRFLGDLKTDGLACAPPALQMIVEDGYGWVEYARSSSPTDEAGIESYFRRAGALQAVAYVLGATDVHMENVIARQDGPVVIDAETFLSPTVDMSALNAASSGSSNGGDPSSSVLDSGLAWSAQVGELGEIFDISALCGAGGQLVRQGARSWHAPNSDGMQLTEENRYVEAQRNLVRLNGRAVPATEYADEILDGFEVAYRHFLSSSDDDSALMERFEDLECRVIVRPSNSYGWIQLHQSMPKYQKRGWIQDVLLEMLNRRFSGYEQRPVFWPLASEERDALRSLDVPVFRVPVAATDWSTSRGDRVEGLFLESGLEAAERRLTALGNDDLEHKLRSLREVLGRSYSREESAAVTSTNGHLGNGSTDWADPLMRVARSMAGDVLNQALSPTNGELRWDVVVPDGQSEAEALVTQASIYSGNGGAALFLAAMASVTKEERYSEAARRAAVAVGKDLESLRDYDDAIVNVGVCNGVGSIIYAHCCVASMLDDSVYIDRAMDTTSLITEDRVAADRAFEVATGSAGAILALLALYRMTDEAQALQCAEMCAEHLIESAVETKNDGLAWKTPKGVEFSGFAHGASGIATSLARLYEVTDDEQYLDVAKRALAYEQTLFVPKHRNWVSFGFKDDKVVPMVTTAWCHGAAGISLARLRVLHLMNDEQIRRDLDVGLSTTNATAGSKSSDTICCGSMSLVETLLTAGLILQKGELLQRAAGAALQELNRALREQAGWRVDKKSPWSFFGGWSGIGYECLRLSQPNKLQSVLLFEPPLMMSRRKENVEG